MCSSKYITYKQGTPKKIQTSCVTHVLDFPTPEISEL